MSPRVDRIQIVLDGNLIATRDSNQSMKYEEYRAICEGHRSQIKFQNENGHSVKAGIPQWVSASQTGSTFADVDLTSRRRQ